ncbi:MAG: single-stranded-DNA-specific exonuclease RecJ [Aureliella sp.]
MAEGRTPNTAGQSAIASQDGPKRGSREKNSKSTSGKGHDHKQWRFAQQDQAAVDAFCEKYEVHPVVAQLLLKQGLEGDDAVRRFLDAKLTDLRAPQQLPGVNEAVERIWTAIQGEEEIVVYGDYDADGMTSTAILYRCLKLLDAKVSYHLPNRMEEGYGLHVDSIEKLAARGKQLVITVDCGIASVEPAKRAKELGLSLVVTDHHRFGDQLPEADALVHPALPGSDYPFAGLCGAGVAFKLAWALCQKKSGAVRVDDHLRDFLLSAIGLAAIGTVADVVPLQDENRVIVRNGLKALAQHSPLGVRKLLEMNKLADKKALDSEDIGFTIAPRLNAAGRLGQAQLGVELLITEDDARADALASYIHELNANRQKLERSINISATKQLKETHCLETDPAFVLASPSWHPGVIGIVAGKLAEKHHRPVVLIALDKLGAKPGTGSARSPNGVNLHAALMQCSDLLVSGGGHAAAAGLKVEENNVPAFRSAFLEAVAEQASEVETVDQLEIDAEATLNQLDLMSVNQIEKLGPFGSENPRPVFVAKGVKLADAAQPLGESGLHLSVRLEQFGKQIRAVNFGKAESWLPELDAVDGTIDIAFRPVINEFRGFRSVEVHLIDFRPSQTAVPTPHFA